MVQDELAGCPTISCRRGVKLPSMEDHRRNPAVCRKLGNGLLCGENPDVWVCVVDHKDEPMIRPELGEEGADRA
jgi:hypothetical protein